MKKVLYLIAATVVLLCMMSCISRYADSQFYFPEQRYYGTPLDRGLQFEDVEFASADGTELTGWFVPAVTDEIGTVIHLHGNAQNMSTHFGYVDWLPSSGFNVFTFDYRGYGRSAGKPERDGVYEDAVAAIKYVKSRTDIDQNNLVVLGQSLGGANAIAAVGDNEFDGIRAVVIEATFYSYRDIASDKVFAPLAYLFVSNDHSAGPAVGKIAPTPILFIHGTDDRVISHKHSEKLLEAAGEPKELWTIDRGGHTEAFTTYQYTYRPKLLEYLKKQLDSDPDLRNP